MFPPPSLPLDEGERNGNVQEMLWPFSSGLAQLHPPGV